MKKFMMLILALGCSVAGAQSMDVIQDSDNPQFAALVQKLKLGTCVPGSYSASLDADDDGTPYDLNYAENKQAHDLGIEMAAELMKEEGVTYTVVKTVNDSPISFVQLVDVDGEKMADRYVYLSGYEFNEWCMLK